MTVEDLKALIAEMVTEQLNQSPQGSADLRSSEQALATMDQLRWTPPPGATSTTELLRQDRDR